MTKEPANKNPKKTGAALEETPPFRSYPSNPKLTLEAPPRVKNSRRKRRGKIRFGTTGPKINGSRVARSVPYNFLAVLRTGRIFSFLGLLASLGVGYFFLNSPDFKTTRVEIPNGHFLTPGEILQATAVDQQNVFLLDEGVVAAKIKKLSYVLDARVTKAFPNIVTIDVTERYSTLNWQVGSVNYLVDPEGIILETYVQLPPASAKLPVIRSVDDRPLKIGDRVDQVAVRSAPLILKKLKEINFGLDSLEYTPTGGLIALGIKDQGSRKIVIGTDAELEKKARLLRALMADSSVKWTFADLRFTAKPVIQ